MKVEYHYDKSILKFHFIFENSDKTSYDTYERKHVVKDKDMCTYHLPKDYNINQLDNDRLALSIILNIYSFIGKQLVLPFQTNEHFNNTVQQKLKFTIVNKPNQGMTQFSKEKAVTFAKSEEINNTQHDPILETEEELAILEDEVNSTGYISDNDLNELENMARESALDINDDGTFNDIYVVEDTTVNIEESNTVNIEDSTTVNDDAVNDVAVEADEEDAITNDTITNDAVNNDAITNNAITNDDDVAVNDIVNDDIYERDDVVVNDVAVRTRAGLCLSMGVDSACALTLMPKNTACVFLDRIFPITGETIYNKDHVYNSLQKVKNKGHDVYIVRTDMEYLRKHRGFVIDIGVGVPSILLSNYLGLHSIGYGYSIHNFTHYGNNKLLMNCTGDYCRFNHSKWNTVFKSTGLFLNFITCGLTEIGTQKIVLQSPYNNLASGCMRGTVGNPCQKCSKCYRKLLLEDMLKYKRIDDNRGHYNTLSKSSEHHINKIFGEFSSGLVMAYSYALRNYKGNDLFLKTVKSRLIKENNFNWKNKIKYIEKWFNGANDRIDPYCMDHLKKRLSELNIPMVN